MIINEINNTLRLGSFHYGNEHGNDPISMTEKCNFYHNKYEAEKVLDGILNLFPDMQTYLMDNHHEVYKYFSSWTNIKFIRDYFEKNGLGDKLIFSDNAVNFDSHSFFSINTDNKPHFLGLSYPNNKEITERKFNKKFLFLNRLPKGHRFHLYKYFHKTGLLDNMIWSFNSHDPNASIHKSVSKKSDGFTDNVWEHHTYDVIPEYTQTFCSIVTETNYGYHDESWFFEGTKDCFFVTEKTEKCFAAGQPFVIASTPHFLSTLKDMGFHTFNGWWDESYDLIENPIERMYAITETVGKINSYSISELEEIYKEMIPTLIHNQNVNNEYWKKNKTDVRYFYDFSPMSWNQYSLSYGDGGKMKKELLDRKFLI